MSGKFHTDLDLGKLVVFLFQKFLEKNPLVIMVVFYGTSSLVISGAYRDIPILK